MHRISIYIISIIIILQTSLLAYSSDPKNFVNELVNDAISKLSDKNLSKDEKANFIEKIAKSDSSSNIGKVTQNALNTQTLENLSKNQESLIDTLRNQFDEKEDLYTITKSLNEWLEKMIKNKPEQWIWSHNRWKL